MYLKLRLYPTVEELTEQAKTFNSLSDEQFKRLEVQGIPTALIKYLKKRRSKCNALIALSR